MYGHDYHIRGRFAVCDDWGHCITDEEQVSLTIGDPCRHAVGVVVNIEAQTVWLMFPIVVVLMALFVA